MPKDTGQRTRTNGRARARGRGGSKSALVLRGRSHVPQTQAVCVASCIELESTEVSERVALKQGRFTSGWAYAIYLCALKYVLYAHPPLQSQVMDSRPWAYNTYSTVVQIQVLLLITTKNKSARPCPGVGRGMSGLLVFVKEQVRGCSLSLSVLITLSRLALR